MTVNVTSATGQNNLAFDIADHGDDLHKTHRSYSSTGRKRGCSTLEKVLLLLVAVLLAALVTLAVLILSKSKDETAANERYTEKDADICMTKECVSAAARLDSYIDYSVPACDDFYQFACGRWLKENVIPSDKSSLSTFGILRDQVDIVLKNLLEETAGSSDLESVKKVKDLYKSCMNLDLINSRGNQALKDLLHIEFGGWPLTSSNWSVDTFDLPRTLAKLNAYSILPIVKFFVQVDFKNSSKNTLKIDQPSFGMPGQKYYQVARNESRLMAYEELIYQVGQLLGFADPDTARQQVIDIVDFEILLANLSVRDEERRDSNSLYNPMTLADIHRNYSGVFDWQTYVQYVLAQSTVGTMGITDQEIIINHSPQYYAHLNVTLAATPKRTLANYIIWRFVRSVIHTLGEKYHVHLTAYRKALLGQTSEQPRFRSCVSYCTGSMGLAVGRMFIRENFDAESKNTALQMIRSLQTSFNELLHNLDWMDEQTKMVAKEKNEFISPKIGYPEQIMNNSYLELLYSQVALNKDKYFENVVAFMKEGFRKSLMSLREVVDKNRWESPPSTVNAFYSSIKNQIMFPAGILQAPFFSRHYPKSLNFGGIGYFIGHEITHGFDDHGRQYDKHGNLQQWWSQAAVDKFKDKAKCIIHQYENFTVSEVNMNLNGINTQGENIADNGGLKQAFKAYRNWVAEQGKEEPLLPGLKFNHNQLFFINFAQLWCTMMTEGDALSRIKTGVHSPGRFRVIGSAQNCPDFAKAFDCPLNSYMNPQKKCTVW